MGLMGFHDWKACELRSSPSIPVGWSSDEHSGPAAIACRLGKSTLVCCMRLSAL
jgi:hypothetical protein